MIGVITEIPEPESGHNMAAAFGLYEVDSDDEHGIKVRKLSPSARMALMLEFRVEVFTLGEILIVDDSGREYAGKGRKPSKWGVGFEYFDDLDAATAKAIEVSTRTGL